MKMRSRLAELLEPRQEGDRLGHVVDLSLMALILANVVVAMLDTMPVYTSRWGTGFHRFETFSVLVFTVEYLARIWTCVDLPSYHHLKPFRARLKWMLSPLGIIDLLAILPFFLFLLLPTEAYSTLVLRLFRALRLMRVFKLARYSKALEILQNVLRREAHTLLLITALLLVLLVIAAWGMYLLEGTTHPEQFSSVPDALWWAVITLTTVGYGDVVPVTTGGRVFAGMVAIIGVAMVALPAGVLAAGFGHELRRREQAYNRALKTALADGSITAHQAHQLIRVRDELGLSEQEAHEMFLDAKLHPPRLSCPYCGKHWHPE
jgi:voltage-gated potassium channel